MPVYLGLEGDLLDALVLGPRLPLGTRIRVKAWGAVTLTDRGMTDDKLVCSDEPPSPAQRRNVLRFFRFYAKCKGLLNLWRAARGATYARAGAAPPRRSLAPGRETTPGGATGRILIEGNYERPFNSNNSYLNYSLKRLTPPAKREGY